MRVFGDITGKGTERGRKKFSILFEERTELATISDLYPSVLFQEDRLTYPGAAFTHMCLGYSKRVGQNTLHVRHTVNVY